MEGDSLRGRSTQWRSAKRGHDCGWPRRDHGLMSSWPPCTATTTCAWPARPPCSIPRPEMHQRSHIQRPAASGLFVLDASCPIHDSLGIIHVLRVSAASESLQQAQAKIHLLTMESTWMVLSEMKTPSLLATMKTMNHLPLILLGSEIPFCPRKQGPQIQHQIPSEIRPKENYLGQRPCDISSSAPIRFKELL